MSTTLADLAGKFARCTEAYKLFERHGTRILHGSFPQMIHATYKILQNFVCDFFQTFMQNFFRIKNEFLNAFIHELQNFGFTY